MRRARLAAANVLTVKEKYFSVAGLHLRRAFWKIFCLFEYIPHQQLISLTSMKALITLRTVKMIMIKTHSVNMPNPQIARMARTHTNRMRRCEHFRRVQKY